MTFLDELRAAVGESAVVASDDVDRFERDWSGRYRAPALAVVRPGSVEQVVSVVQLCATHGIGVIAQGGNTGLCGGSVPTSDGESARQTIIVNLSRLDAIGAVDVDNATVTVQAGATIQAVQEAAAGADLLFAPDWGARGTAQVGGGIATNAGGLNVLRWGSMREQVLGLEVVLPDGRVWDGLRSLRKDATGLDPKQLFIGTEGTIGIITAAVLRLHPRPSVHRTAFASLPELAALLPLFAHARAVGRGLLSAFELIPEEGLRRVLANVADAQRPLLSDAEWNVLIRCSGDEQTDETLTDILAGAVDQGLITDAAVAATGDQEINLWLLRDELPSIYTFGERGNRHKFDIALPISRTTEFIDRAAELVDRIVPGTLTYAFGHVGDGNLHFNIYPGPEADESQFDERGAELERAVDELTWELGGTISAEHGIGQAMRHRLARQKSAVELDLMQAVKDALDPEGLMNPGKLYPVRDGASGLDDRD